MDPNDFEGALGKKRRHDDDHIGDDEDDGSDNEHQTSKSRGTVTVQIFIKKTYTMINDCDPKIASWTAEGDKFVIKDPDMFAQKVIPQYFDHNKFSSFTRQLNFYKFTREQSKAIKKSDNSSEIAKHQTFYHKYFQRGRPDLLKHLQRSRKTHSSHDDDHHSSSSKKPKTVSSASFSGDQSVMEQISDLSRRVNESEMTIKNLQQENSTLSFSMQKLQQQDEMKQRALVALEEHVRVMEVQMTQAIQQQQAQLRNISNPLPFDRESSYSAVNPSTLMRYLSMNNGLQRLTTPPFGQLTAAGAGGLGAAQTAEALVANEKGRSLSPTLARHPRMRGALAAGGTSPTSGGDQGGPTLSRHPRMRGSGGMGGGTSATSGGGPDLPRHMKMKEAPEGTSASTAAAVAASMDAALEAANGGNAPTLRRHPRMKNAEIQSGGQQNNNGGNMMNRVTFQDNTMSGMGDAARSGLDGKQEGTKGDMHRLGLGNGNGSGAGRISPSPTPNIIAQNGFSGTSQLVGSFPAGNRSGGSPKPPGGASGLERELSAGGLGLSGLGAAGLGGLGAAGLGNLGAGGLSGLGLGAAGLSAAGLGAAGLGSLGLGAAGLGGAGLGGASGLGAAGLGAGLGAANLAAATGLQEREISNIGTEVTREESFSIASLLDLARGSQQPI